MVSTKVYKPYARLETQKAQVFAALLNGKTRQTVAHLFGATKDGVRLFEERHQAELTRMRERATEKHAAEAAELWITDRYKTSVVLQRQVKHLDERSRHFFTEPAESAALGRAINQTIETAYKVNDMWPKTNVNVDARKQTLNFIDGVRLPEAEVQELLGEINDLPS